MHIVFVAAIASIPSIIKKENEKMKLENTK